MPAAFEGKNLLLELQKYFLVYSEAFCFSDKITTWKIEKSTIGAAHCFSDSQISIALLYTHTSVLRKEKNSIKISHITNFFLQKLN